jgi:small-conductance mechanosensitive channel
MSQPTQVDPRGLRFAAGITSVVLAIALVTPVRVAVVLLSLQAIVFAFGAFGSLQRAPYGLLFAKAVRPRIGAPAEFEDDRPPRFAQLVGLLFLVVALAGFLTEATAVGYAATAFALIAALLNASVGFCLGCEMYLAFRRFAPVKAA